MKSIKYLLLLCLPLFFSQCYIHDENPDDDLVWMRYLETKCADAWLTGENDSAAEVINAVEDYFKPLDIERIRVTFDDRYAQACEACICTSGRIIEVRIHECLEDLFEEEGFVER